MNGIFIIDKYSFSIQAEPFFPHPEDLVDYVYISTIPMEDRVRGSKGPASKASCEVIIMNEL